MVKNIDWKYNRTRFAGQIIGGRDDAIMAVLPFILQNSKLGEAMKDSNYGDFTFTFTVEDHKRVYYPDVEICVPVEDSAGGALKTED